MEEIPLQYLLLLYYRNIILMKLYINIYNVIYVIYGILCYICIIKISFSYKKICKPELDYYDIIYKLCK